MHSVMDAITLWESDMLAYVKAGGTDPHDEERRNQVMKLLPANISMEELGKSNEVRNEQGQRDTDSLIEWLREKETFLLEHGTKAQHAHVAAGEPQPGTQWAKPPPGA